MKPRAVIRQTFPGRYSVVYDGLTYPDWERLYDAPSPIEAVRRELDACRQLRTQLDQQERLLSELLNTHERTGALPVEE